MRYYLKIFALFFLNLVSWNICVFIASMIAQTDMPTTISMITATILIIGASFTISRLGTDFFIEEKTNKIYLSISTAIFVLLMILLITITNGTTQLFFGNIFSYFTFFGVGIGNYLGMRKVLPSS